MSVQTVARKDLADAGRSSALWAVAALAVLFTGGVSTLAVVFADVSAQQMLQLISQLAAFIFPILALMAAKGAITQERESGSLRTLLSLPPSRGDVLLGKFLGRSTLVLFATFAGTLVTGVVVGVALGVSEIGLVAALAVFLALMAVAFVSVGVGVSAAASTDGRATAFAVGYYILTVVLWSLIVRAITFLAAELGLIATGAESLPGWIQFLRMAVPNEAAIAAYRAVAAGHSLFGSAPLQSVWLPTLVLFAWIVLPVAGGLVRFRRADLG
ncbi:MAG: ABC transporter permease subunit [Halobaculum sp.]